MYEPDIDIKKITLNGNMKDLKISILFEIYHTNAKDCKSVSDEVTKQLMAAWRVLAGTNRMTNMEVSGDGTDSWQEGTMTVHRASFTCTWRYVESGL